MATSFFIARVASIGIRSYSYWSRGEIGQILKVRRRRQEAAALVQRLGRANVEPLALDCGGDVKGLEAAIKASTAALSLLPAPMHGAVVSAGITHGKPIVTASYVSDELFGMSAAAEAAGVPVLGEMGLDPGMDHMSAMQLIDEAKAGGGLIRSFRSVCGGLPAPEAANNPLCYKFSWSPRGVLSAAMNSARYLENGEIQVRLKIIRNLETMHDSDLPTF